MKICHIGGYELLRDGTCFYNIKNIAEMVHFLVDCEVFIDQQTINSSKSDLEIFTAIEEIWNDLHNDGGGSGWFENTEQFNIEGLLDKVKDTEWIEY